MKGERTKLILGGILVTIFIVIITIFITIIEYDSYKKSVNQYIYGLVNNLKEKYPEVKEKEIVELLNQDTIKKYDDNFKKYGINEQAAALYNLELNFKNNLQINITFLLFVILLGIIFFFWYFNLKERKIKEIADYMREINRKNYLLSIKDNGEGELSILKNEVYKTTIMLREESDQLKTEKLVLKNSISDISHQLKTPLTSILIMLDNILDNPKMDEKTKNDFIINVHHQVEHINFLIVSLLKLSRIDADVIEFKKEKINVQKIIQEVLKNVEILKEVKNINIRYNIDKNIFYKGDYKWELEALTNLIKNAVEYSKDSGKIEIIAEDNPLFTRIIIKDYGEGMTKQELKNIFKRFYKGENSSSDSIGIGLNLAKKIIEKDNGYIKVKSKKNEGTVFEIRYMK